MAGGDTGNLVVTNGCYRFRLLPGREEYLPDLLAGLCTEAYRVQMRGVATGSDGLAEISETDFLDVLLPRLADDSARKELQRHAGLLLQDHASVHNVVRELERRSDAGLPRVPTRKTVFVQV